LVPSNACGPNDAPLVPQSVTPKRTLIQIGAVMRAKSSASQPWRAADQGKLRSEATRGGRPLDIRGAAQASDPLVIRQSWKHPHYLETTFGS